MGSAEAAEASGESGAAIVLRDGGVRHERRARPEPVRDDDVVVRVAFAGVCRTDLFVADGRLAATTPRVLGHEASGIVVAAGRSASALLGARVALDPYDACGACAGCASAGECDAPAMLGKERDGVFAAYVRVPSARAVRLPEGTSLLAGAFLEPVAATLAIANATLPKEGVGVVLGTGRIARLALDVLRAKDFSRVTGDGPHVAPSSADFAVETSLDPSTLARAADVVRPRGRVVVKSRPFGPVAIDLGPFLRKEIALEPVWYGDFHEAAALLGPLDAAGRFDAPRPLEAFEEVFARARDERFGKQVFRLGGEE